MAQILDDVGNLAIHHPLGAGAIAFRKFVLDNRAPVDSSSPNA